jgi:multiple sugar transport system substrate-binding protein
VIKIGSLTMAIAMAALASTAATPTVAQDAPVKLKWALWDWDATAYYKPLIEAYKAKKPNVTIEYVDLGSTDYQTMLSMQLTGGAKDLDVVTVKDMPGYANLVRAKQLEDLTAFMPANKIDPAAYGGIVEQLGIDGHVYALPFRSDFWIVYYNKDLFDKAGVPYPSNDMTIAQYDALAKKLTSGMGNQKVYGSHLHIWRSAVQLLGILDGKHTVVDGEYEWMKPYYERAIGLQKAGVVQSYAALKTSNTHYSAPFYNASIATLPMGSWFVATQINKVKSGESKAVNWGIVKYPHPEGVAAGTSVATLTLLGVNAASANKAAALEFMKFVTGPEGAEVVAKTGTMPAIQTAKVVDTIAATPGFPTDANSKEALTLKKGYIEMPIHNKAAQIEVVLNRAHDAIMTENISIDAGIAQMNKDVKAILAQP